MFDSAHLRTASWNSDLLTSVDVSKYFIMGEPFNNEFTYFDGKTCSKENGASLARVLALTFAAFGLG